MVYLLLAILSSAMVSIVMRISEGRAPGSAGKLAANYLACLALAGLYMGYGTLFTPARGSGLTAVMGLFNGLLYLLGFVLLQINVRRNGVVLSATFMKLGLLVPMAVSCLFGELPSPMQWAGFLLAIASIILINSEKGRTVMEFRAGLILLLLAGGGGDAMSKVFEELGPGRLSDRFLFYTFAAALLLCAGLMIYKKQRPSAGDAAYGLLIGIPNYFSARFLLLSLSHLPAVVVYPTYSVATIVLVTLAGVLFFREKLGRRQWVAILGILAALALLNA